MIEDVSVCICEVVVLKGAGYDNDTRSNTTINTVNAHAFFMKMAFSIMNRTFFKLVFFVTTIDPQKQHNRLLSND